MKYRPKIGRADFDTKTRSVEKFLGEGHKVKVTIMFRGREIYHPERGRKILDDVAGAVGHLGRVEVASAAQTTLVINTPGTGDDVQTLKAGIMEIADLLGSGQISGHGVSFAADNVLQLKYVEVAGCLERGISVLKARGIRHATDVRRLRITTGQIAVEPGFTGLRGVLTGLPVPAQRGDS